MQLSLGSWETDCSCWVSSIPTSLVRCIGFDRSAANIPWKQYESQLLELKQHRGNRCTDECSFHDISPRPPYGLTMLLDVDRYASRVVVVHFQIPKKTSSLASIQQRKNDPTKSLLLIPDRFVVQTIDVQARSKDNFLAWHVNRAPF